MQVKTITINAFGLMPVGRDIQDSGSPDANRTEKKNKNMFGPECRVTISQEGKKLSNGKQRAESQYVKEEKMLLRQQREAELAKEIRDGYREKLNEIDKQITHYNASYVEHEMKKELYDGALMAETVEEQQKLRTAMQDQKQFQAEESQRRMKEAQQMAVQSAQYNEEIDEDNRDLLTLLKTMEEAEKAEDEQKNGGAKGKGKSASDTGNSADSEIKNFASQFVSSSVNHERIIEEMLAGVEESGRWFLDTADSITQNVLQKTSDIRTAITDKSFTDEQIAEMMQSLQEEMVLNYDDVESFRSFGLQVMRDTREAKIQHIADAPLTDMMQTKRNMLLSAADAVIGEARQSGLDKASRELADEVKKMIAERNDVSRLPQDEEKDKEELREEAEEDEQAGIQEKLLQQQEQDRGSI